MASTRRLCVIGLDAADVGLVRRWSEAGILPTLGALLREGAWVQTRHDGEIPSAAVWPTLVTGTHPGRHGLSNTVQLVPGTRTLQVVRPEACDEPRLWTLLQDAGVTSLVVDVPFSAADSCVRGVRVADWGSYERFGPAISIPDGVLPELERHAGRYPFRAAISRDVPRTPRDERRMLAGLLRGAAVKGAAVRRLIATRSWDLLLAVFGETHAAGHYFWDECAAHADTADGHAAAPLREVYRAVDTQLGEILDRLDDETTVIVLSGQGMGPNIAGWHLLPTFLTRLGLLASTADRRDRRLGPENLLRSLREAVPADVRRAVSRYLPPALRDSLQAHWAVGDIDWAATRAFPLPTDYLGRIRLNVQGREPDGIVKPGAESEAVCAQIIEALERLVHPRTGRPIVKRVIRTDRAFPGPCLDRLPDLMVVWADDDAIDGARSEQTGTITGTLPDPRRGNHRPDGFAFVRGPGITRRRVIAASLFDVAPTILEHFGVSRPPSMTGGSLWSRLTAPSGEGPSYHEGCGGSERRGPAVDARTGT